MTDNKMWLSICSIHREKNPNCLACARGRWYDTIELDEDSALFKTDYVAWFRKHNDGKEPTESAWDIWRQLTHQELDKE